MFSRNSSSWTPNCGATPNFLNPDRRCGGVNVRRNHAVPADTTPCTLRSACIAHGARRMGDIGHDAVRAIAKALALALDHFPNLGRCGTRPRGGASCSKAAPHTIAIRLTAGLLTPTNACFAVAPGLQEVARLGVSLGAMSCYGPTGAPTLFAPKELRSANK
jgi:hypothetical protein